jgi:hypothetical protein
MIVQTYRHQSAKEGLTVANDKLLCKRVVASTCNVLTQLPQCIITTTTEVCGIKR